MLRNKEGCIHMAIIFNRPTFGLDLEKTIVEKKQPNIVSLGK
jgi:hypothetical protein